MSNIKNQVSDTLSPFYDREWIEEEKDRRRLAVARAWRKRKREERLAGRS